MSHCLICQHAQRRILVDHDLRIGLEARLIATRQRFSQSAVIEHWRSCLGMAAPAQGLPEMTTVKDAPIQALPSTMSDHQVTPETPLDVIKPAWPYVRQAARLVKNQGEYEDLIAAINQVLQTETMGLPYE